TPSGGITPTDTRPVAAVTRPGRNRLVGIGLAVVAVGVVGALFLSNRAGSSVVLGHTRQLTNAPGLEVDPAISPDGRLIAYAAGPVAQMHIFVRQMAGGRTIDLTEGIPGRHRSPQWSPDGTQVLFVSVEQGRATINLVPALGGTPRRLLKAPGAVEVRTPIWSPDGRSIAYAQGDAILTMVVEGGPPSKVTDASDPHSLAWSSDGSRISYVSGNSTSVISTSQFGNLAPSAIWVVPARGGAPVRVTEGTTLNVSPVWGHDGKSLLFVSNREGNRDLYLVRLEASGAPAGQPMRLTTGLNAMAVSLSLDGKTLAYSVFTRQGNIWSLPIPTGKPVSVAEARPVTSGSQVIEVMSVSLDGQWLAFDSDRNGNSDIYKMRLPGGEPQQLTTDSADDFSASWSPDGKEIAFHSFRYGTRDIFTMSSDGGPPRRVTDDPGQEYLATWAPDGRRLAYLTALVPGPMVVIERVNDSTWGKPRVIVESSYTGGKWSPDGRTILYVNGLRDALCLVSPDGATPRIIVRVGDLAGQVELGDGARSPDGRTVYFNAYDTEGNASIWSAGAVGGPARLLVRFDDPSRPSYRAQFTADGKRLYFTIGDRQSDIWTVEVKDRETVRR
ncbi:MAG: hypothetical protein ACREMO_05990, partial [Gemmatimonadales bacterium]